MSDVALWQPYGHGLLNGATGQTLDVEKAEDDTLARIRRDVVRVRHLLDDAAAVIDSEVARRLDWRSARSLTADGIELTVNAPHATQWDVTLLREVLDRLANAGRLAPDVVSRALKTEVTYKPVARELAKLLDHNDEVVREAIDSCRSVHPAKRRVTVKEVEQ